eukprot:tig00021254_g19679.t1
MARQLMHTNTKLRGVVFDMDGTLTCDGAIDFVEMRRRAGIPDGHDILQYVHGLPPGERERVMDIIDQVEVEGHERQSLMEGLHDLLGFIDSKGLRRGLLTRNSRKSVDVFLAMSRAHFSTIVTRDFVPTKPHPDPLLHIAETWDTPPSSLVMVGDWVDDIKCGKAAGAHTVMILTPKSRPHADLADFAVESLPEARPAPPAPRPAPPRPAPPAPRRPSRLVRAQLQELLDKVFHL